MASESVRVVNTGGVNIVSLSLPYSIDSVEFDRINDSLRGAVEGKAGEKWVMDLSEVSYIGSAILGMMVNVRQQVKQAGGKLALCGLSERLTEVFRACCMERLFEVSRSRADALKTVARG